MIKADMKLSITLPEEPIYVTINYLGKIVTIDLTMDAKDICAKSKKDIKDWFGKKKYRQIRDDVLNYVKQYMENKDEHTTAV